MKTIPILAETAEEVLSAALNYDCAGYSLIFDIIGEGQWQFNFGNNRFEKIIWHGNVPLVEKTQFSSFDSYIIGQISKGYVTIKVQSTGKNPSYIKEIHRARGVSIPLK